MWSVLFIVGGMYAATPVSVQIKAKKFEKMPLLIAVIKPETEFIKALTGTLVHDFKASNQFAPEIKQSEYPTHKKVMQDYFNQGFPFVLFVEAGLPRQVTWLLYDTLDAAKVGGGTITVEGALSHELVAHKLVDQFWPLLTGRKSSFASVLVAGKQITTKRHGHKKHQYQPYAWSPFSPEKKYKVMEQPAFAYRWHPTKPRLYCSQETGYNIRLSLVLPSGSCRVLTNFDGISMTPVVATDGSTLLSVTHNGCGQLCRYKYDKQRKKGTFSLLTHGQEQHVSLALIDDTHLLCCQINSRGTPRIVQITLPSMAVTPLPYAVNAHSPAYCQATGLIAYCKKADGLFQVFIYDPKKQQEQQVTFDGGDKEECTWSPCGTYLAFAVDNGKSSRIVQYNRLTTDVTFITPANENWNFPAWSPCYDQLPFLN